MAQFEQELGGPVACDETSRIRFWKALDNVLSSPCASYELIDDALRAWLELVSTSRDRYLEDEEDLAHCSQRLLHSKIFAAHGSYVRTQIIYSLLQEDDARPLHVIANFLLLDGRAHDTVFQQMIDAGCFTRLVELIKNRRDDDRRLHRLLLELMYEMSRVERVRTSDLVHVDDTFIGCLFQMIEDLADDFDDPYHYPVIRVLLVLNEQYMVAATTAAVDPSSPTLLLTNRVIKVLSLHGALYRTFGENIILLLNRETETSLQLLILKLMYLVFTTKPTYEYFYTNDLRVLVDVIIRNLLDLPDESTPLRHTYLRVLYPLLAHTQLQQAPHYKRDEILRVLAILSGAGNTHFAPADETTLRLVDRVSKVDWLVSAPHSPTSASPSIPAVDIADTAATACTATAAEAAEVADTIDTDIDSSDVSTLSSASTTSASKTDSNSGRPDSDVHQTNHANHVINKLLGISLSHGASCASVVDVAAVKEKPGVKTPSRRAELELRQQPGGADEVVEKAPPPPPPASPRIALPSSTSPNSATASPVAEEHEPPHGEEHQSHHRRPRRALPVVPRHRHGILMKPVAELGHHETSADAVSSKKHHPRAPPKAPPPRRVGRLRQAVSTANLQAAMGSDSAS